MIKKVQVEGEETRYENVFIHRHARYDLLCADKTMRVNLFSN